jgi:FkbM family methyltransferase
MYIGRSLDAYGEWSEAEVSLLAQVLRPGDIAVDAGANIGTHTVPFAKRVTTSGAVIAFEPQRLTYQILCANVALNVLLNVKCLNAAAGDARGEVRMPVVDPRNEYNFGSTKSEGQQQGERTDVLPIDDLQLARCRLIKIDVEGMELRVLAGARRTITSHRPVLFVENNTEEESPAILAALHDLKYACWWQVASHFNPHNYFGNPEQLFPPGQLDANVLCSPAEASVNATGLGPVNGRDDTPLTAIHRHWGKS